jgi:hypothetical protein
MNELHSKSVVVGIDGSQASLNAAKRSTRPSASNCPFALSMSLRAERRNSHRRAPPPRSSNTAKRCSTRQASPRKTRDNPSKSKR